MTIELYAYRHPANWHWPRTLTLRLIYGDRRYWWTAEDVNPSHDACAQASNARPGARRGYGTLRAAEWGAIRAGWTVQRIECPLDVDPTPYRHEVRP